MAIYEIQKNGDLRPIKSIPFKNEDELHRISEENLSVLFGLEYVQMSKIQMSLMPHIPDDHTVLERWPFRMYVEWC